MDAKFANDVIKQKGGEEEINQILSHQSINNNNTKK